MTVAVITDGAACLPADLADRSRVVVVPLQVSGPAGHAPAYPPRDAEELRGWLAGGVRTAGPSPGQFLAALDGCPDAVLLTVARSMSSTYEAATVAARQAGGRVQVLDTGTAAGGQGLVVLAAARVAAAGRPLDEVAAAAVRAAAGVRLVAAVPSLTWLLRGGRLPRAAVSAGRGVHPLFEFRSGRIVPLRPSLSPDAARRRLLDRWRRTRLPGARLHIAALHACAADEAACLLDRVTREVTPDTAFVGEFSLAMAAHTGPGVLGLAWHWTAP